MAKYQKLAIAPDGAIVFRATGKVAIGDLKVKDNRVYKNGRLYGYLGKPTKTQQAKIEKVAKSPARKRRAKLQEEVKKIRVEGVTIVPLPTDSTSKSVRQWLSKTRLTADALRYIRKTYGDYGALEVSKVTQSRLNYAKVIGKAVNSGKLSVKDADSMLKQMYNATKNEDRLKLWKQTAELFDKLGYKYDVHARIKDAED